MRLSLQRLTSVIIGLGFYLSTPIVFSQTTVTIGSGTSTQGGPVSRFFRYHASEFIYLQSEINETGEIQSIAFDKRSGTDNNPILNVEIYMKHTVDNSLASGTTNTVGYTLVYSGSFTNNTATGWMSVDLDTPFDYNNSDNLQILIIKGNQAPLTSAQYPRYAYSTVAPNRFRSYSDDSNPWSTTRTLNPQAGPPNARIVIEDVCVQPAQPTTACYETATWNVATCQWDVTGTQPLQPTTACYETAIWNDVSCEWDVTGTQPEGVDEITACNSYEWIDGNTYTASNSTATFTVVNGAANGCDSLVTLNLTITTVDNTVTTNGMTLTSTQPGATYQWINCANNQEISGATNQSFTASSNGSYKVEITLGDCVEESTCVSVSNLSTGDDHLAQKIAVYPNPTKNKVTIQLPEGEQSVKVFSTLGQVIIPTTNFNGTTFELNLNNYPAGLYFVEIHHNNYSITKKIIKE